MEAAAKLLEAVAALVSAIAWPVVMLILAMRFSKSISSFLAGLGELSFKGAGIEASARKHAQQAAVLAATVSEARKGSSPENIAHEAELASNVIGSAATARLLKSAKSVSILWVDDTPEKNKHERESISALGARIDLAASTEEAIRMLLERTYDFVVSDMGRPGDREAGYTLLDEMKAKKINTPIAIYTAGVNQADKNKAEKKGAAGITSKASELFEIIMSALRNGAI